MCFMLFCLARPWRWRRYVPPRRRWTFNRLHGVISQKIAVFVLPRTRFFKISTSESLNVVYLSAILGFTWAACMELHWQWYVAVTQLTLWRLDWVITSSPYCIFFNIVAASSKLIWVTRNFLLRQPCQYIRLPSVRSWYLVHNYGIVPSGIQNHFCLNNIGCNFLKNWINQS
jgi:hypothetical protein